MFTFALGLKGKSADAYNVVSIYISINEQTDTIAISTDLLRSTNTKLN